MTTCTQVTTPEKQELRQTAPETTRNRRVFVPRVDIFETPSAVTLTADMPGVDGNSIDVTLEKNILTIKGYTEFTPPEGFHWSIRGYGYGDYQRSFALSDEVDRDNISATVKDGVLKLVLPKSTEARTKRITVKAE